MTQAFASILIPRFKYFPHLVTISLGVNDTVTFRETTAVGSTALIAPGTYNYGDLAYQVKKALDSAGASTYIVRYSFTTRKFTITSDLSGGDGIFELVVGGAGDALPTLGFTATVTGAAQYTSGTAVPSLTTIDFSTVLRFPRVRRVVDRESLTLENGRTETVSFGGIYEVSFLVEYESPAVGRAWALMVEELAEFGDSAQFYPDNTDTTNYLDVTFSDAQFDYREMLEESLYRLYSFAIAMRIAVPNSGTLDGRSLLDRRPS